MGQNLDIAADAIKGTASDLTIIPRGMYNAIDKAKMTKLANNTTRRRLTRITPPVSQPMPETPTQSKVL